jgi:hypothetical protein
MLRPVFLSHRCVYTGGIPQFAQALTAKDPELAQCFIPLAEVGPALRELEGYPGAKPGEHTRRFASVRKRYLEGKSTEESKNKGSETNKANAKGEEEVKQ